MLGAQTTAQSHLNIPSIDGRRYQHDGTNFTLSILHDTCVKLIIARNRCDDNQFHWHCTCRLTTSVDKSLSSTRCIECDLIEHVTVANDEIVEDVIVYK